MKVGDLVRVADCEQIEGVIDFDCVWFFCNGNSTRMGIVITESRRVKKWIVMFDCGEWSLDMFDLARGDVKVISEITI